MAQAPPVLLKPAKGCCCSCYRALQGRCCSCCCCAVHNVGAHTYKRHTAIAVLLHIKPFTRPTLQHAQGVMYNSCTSDCTCYILRAIAEGACSACGLTTLPVALVYFS